MSNLSAYVLKLDKSDSNRYISKLQFSFEDQILSLPDPYNIDDGWYAAHADKLPPVQYLDLYNYLINTPGPCTGEALRAYKSLEAYNYFVCGHVQNMKQNDISETSPVAFVAATVAPGQRTTEEKYKPWVCVGRNGCIVATHCTCAAGLGEACSHIAALLFAIESITQSRDRNEVSCTDIPCQWKKCEKQNTTSCTAENLDMSHPRHGKVLNSRKRKKRKEVPGLSIQEQQQAFAELREILPTAAVLVRDSSDTDTASESEDAVNFPQLPYRLARLTNAYNCSPQTIIDDAIPTKAQVDNLSQATVAQSQSHLWSAQRRGRVTASNIHRVINRKADGASAVRTIMQYDNKSISHIPAVKWGTEHEDTARDEFYLHMTTIHTNFVLKRTGLIIYQPYPFLAASPDGISTCDCHGDAVLEIKCPFKYKDLCSTEILQIQDTTFCLDAYGNLKKTHQYYDQVQTQMLVTNYTQCNFVIWTEPGLVIVSVPRDEDHIANLLHHTKVFVETYLIPELLNKQMDTSQSDDAVICTCSRPKFGRTIICSNENCTVKMYHYSCVGIKRKPKQWLCFTCR